jgi:hypothetical protein
MYSSAQVDSDSDGIADMIEEQIALNFVPTLQFKSGEEFFPVNVEYHISNSDLMLKTSAGDQTISSDPTIELISTYTSGDYYLNNRLGGLSEISADYTDKRSSLPIVSYARVTPSLNSYIVQYWFFYAFNEGPLNEHEGDWEMVEVIVDPSGENALSASYSQHISGQTASWGDVEKVDGSHPIVYVALGSHANYFRSYQGNFGFESDIVGNDGETISHSQIEIVLLGEPGPGNRVDSQAWLDYSGRWGDWELFADALRGTAGPSGPAHGDNSDKWGFPFEWSSSLRDLDGTILVLNLILANFIIIFGLIVLIASVVKVRGILSLIRKEGLQIGKILRSKSTIGVILGVLGIGLTVGAILTPWYAVKGDIQSQEIQTDGSVNIVLVDGFDGLQVNTLQEGQGLSSMFNLAIPFAIVLIISVIFSLIDIVGAKSPGGLGSKFIRSGISNLIPVILIIIFVFQLSTIVDSMDSMGGVEIGPEAKDFAQKIASSPIQGDYSTSFGSYGSVALNWGLELGSYLFIGAAIVKFIAGFITRSGRIEEQQVS